MTAAQRQFVKHLAAMPEPSTAMIDVDGMARAMFKNLGIPKKWIRSPAETALFRKRSAAAKLGWLRRRREKLYLRARAGR